MNIISPAQKNYLFFRKIHVGRTYMLPRNGFTAYAAPGSKGERIDTNPFTKSLDASPVELIEIQGRFAKVKFLHSCKGKRPEFWIKCIDLEYRGMMASLIMFLMLALPFSVYNIFQLCKSFRKGESK